jgi:hypothetical protein
MDVNDASYYIFNEKGNKGSQMGHTKKIFNNKTNGITITQLDDIGVSKVGCDFVFV